jgi:hypothetical protein
MAQLAMVISAGQCLIGGFLIGMGIYGLLF